MNDRRDEESQNMMMKRTARRKFVDKVVETTIDDNPKYTSAMRMPSPAPPAHFLRIFGQPARDLLGDHRDHSPSMRQALMMLNGKLSHEASRVGKAGADLSALGRRAPRPGRRRVDGLPRDFDPRTEPEDTQEAASILREAPRRWKAWPTCAGYCSIARVPLYSVSDGLSGVTNDAATHRALANRLGFTRPFLLS